ncbi:MAG: hypothetical protein ACFFD4_02945 [Candidatus Odinarchaeota archaeon]
MKKIKGGQSTKKHIFEGKMREYQEQIIKVFNALGIATSQNPKETIIYGYVLIHYRLTQKQLRDLTDYSAGTVSSCTSRLLITGLLKKKRIPGTRGYEYFAPYNMIQLLDGWRAAILVKIASTRLFFQEIQKKARKSDFIFSRIEEMLEFIEINEEMVHLYDLNPPKEKEKMEASSVTPLNKTKNTGPSENKIDSAPLEEIERDIVNHFMEELQETLFHGQNDSTVLMLAYFFTRGTLTQKQLRKITGLSVGAVSQGVKLLLAWKFIEKNPTFDSHYRAPYQMKSVKKTYLNFFAEILRRRMQSKPHLEKIRDELDIEFAKLNTLHGYKEVYNTVSQLLRIFPIHERALELLEERSEIDGNDKVGELINK